MTIKQCRIEAAALSYSVGQRKAQKKKIISKLTLKLPFMKQKKPRGIVKRVYFDLRPHVIALTSSFTFLNFDCLMLLEYILQILQDIRKGKS